MRRLPRHEQRFGTWLRLLDRLVPLQIRTDKVQRTRAYIIIGIILFNLLMSVLSGVVILLATDLTGTALAVALSLVAECILLYALALYFFRRRHSALLAGNMAALAIYVAVLSGVLLTGGYPLSPIMPLWIVAPVFVFLLSGLTSGLVWSYVILGTQVVLIVLHTYGFEAWQFADEESLQLLARVLPVLLCFMVIIALIIYERVNARLNQWLDEEKQRFAFKASHDSLTDLPNREEFFNRLETALRESQQRGQQLAVAYIDLDGFKPINDQFGHYAGDKVLKITSVRLREVIRHTDIAARMGGDEFALILPGVKRRADIDLVLMKMLHTLAIPIDIDGRDVQVKASAGVALFPQDGRDPDTLCRLADAAMYQAKNEKNTYRYHSPARP